MIVDCTSDDIVYSNLFSGILGNYLKPAIVALGLDPDNLPQSDPSQMNFASGSSTPNGRKVIWGSGQGLGPFQELVRGGGRVGRCGVETAASAARLAVGVGAGVV